MSKDLGFEEPDRIEKLFEGKTVFIAGATGFLGKVILEKLLRSCPKVHQVVTLVRSKKNKGPQERMKETLEDPLFEKVRKQYGPRHFEKIIPIEGDISRKNLGLSPVDRVWLCENVQIVFHCAATVRFDVSLKTAVSINVNGTKQMLELAKEMLNLKVFIHVSTAYCHLEEAELHEKVYDPPADPHKILYLCESFEEEELELLAPRIMKRSPNTYSFTKALSEALVVEQMEHLPAVIVRPSVVVPIWKEPIPGWTDNLNGPTGLMIGAGKGVIRTMYVKENSYEDYIPVDIVANFLLTVAFLATINPDKRIYHATTYKDVRITNKELMEMGRKIIETKVPLPGVLWYPGGSMKSSKLHNTICFFLFQWIPAVIVDAVLYALGYPPVLMKVQKRVSKGCELLEYYANNQWNFNNKESLEQRKILNSTEKIKYKFDVEGFNHEQYLINCALCARRYILKVPDETIPSDRRHMLVMWIIDRLCKFLVIFGLFYYLFSQFL